MCLPRVVSLAVIFLAVMASACAFAAETGVGAPVIETPEREGALPVWRVALDNPVVALFSIVALGLLLGQIKVFGVSLGASGVMFVALFFGALGVTLPSEVGSIGLVLFAYCIGITAGPGFFRAFYEQGTQLAKLSCVLILTGVAVTIGFALLADIPPGLAAGVFAGAMTSTPALAAAMDALPSASDVSIGYGIAYPFGIAGVVLFVQLVPRLLRTDLDKEAAKQPRKNVQETVRRELIEIENPAVDGKRIDEVRFLCGARCQISRVLKGNRLVPVTSETTLKPGQHVLAVGRKTCLAHVTEFLGKASDHPYSWDPETERMQVVVTAKQVVGQTLAALNPLNRFGVTVSRITRNDVTFAPRSDTVIHRADVLLGVGEPESLREFATFAGHRARVLDETDLISLAVGVTVGVLLGMIPIGFPGSRSFALGMAGGPLLVGLLLGHFGRVGRIRGHIPRASRFLMTEIGLVFFLASAGAKAGGRFVGVLQEQGSMLLVMGFLVTLAPMVCGYLFARYVLKLNLLQTLGGTCGSMTSTPGLGVITSRTDSDIPMTSYAAAYPVALILMTLFAQVVVSVVS